jgi:REP element-mobilizing transposase RayT
MARPIRVQYAGAWYHVTSRGQERQEIFKDDRDRGHFLELLGLTVARYRVRIHAYVLMDNHYHLIIETPEANLSRAVQWLNVSYSVWYNLRHGRVGHLVQGRFKAIVMESAGWGLKLSIYIHLNPVRVAGLGLNKAGRKVEAAGVGILPSREMVIQRLKVLRGYTWSSYRAYAGYAKPPEWLERKVLMQRAGNGEESYRKLVEGELKDSAAESPWGELKAGIALGTRAFTEKLRKRLVIGRETAGKRLIRRRLTFEDVREAVELVKGEKWSDFADRHGDNGRALVYKAAWDYAGMTMGEIGVKSGGADYAAVGITIRRLNEKLKHNKNVSNQWSRIKEKLEERTQML